MTRSVTIAVLIATLFACFAHAALAEERITRFRSTIEAHQDRSMRVVETISIIAEGERINHGIYRDFPTLYRSPQGINYRVAFTVVSVERDGNAEPYQVERISNGKRIRIGSAETFVPRGEHTYRITYDTGGQLGFFEDYDELYWNVNGLGWEFVTDAVEADVTLPSGARIIDYTGYTGPAGSTAKEFRAEKLSDNRIRFETTRALGYNEGLTIVVSWPKGIVPEPTDAERTTQFLTQNLSVFAAGAGFILVFAYYMAVWLRVGRDPPRGPIVPLYRPPKGLSPASARFIRRMGYDRKAFTAALVDMAVKGYLKIKESGSGFEIERIGDTSQLTRGEEDVGRALFAGKTTPRATLKMSNDNHVKFGNAVNDLREALEAENQKTMFLRNQGYFWIGLLVTIAVAVVTAYFSPLPEEVIFGGLVLTFWVGISAFFSTRAWQRIKSGANSFGDRIAGIFQVAFVLLIAAMFGIAALAMGTELAQHVGVWAAALIAATGALNVIFFELLKAPTISGRAVMDQIEGLRMYLGTAEKDRLDFLTPPKETPETFEKLLPYAIALDVENEWNKHFEKILAEASQAPGDGRPAYSPAWYAGPRISSLTSGTFAGALGGALASAAASAATAPGSSSGFSGGSSGGGGGGGGGGGW